MQFHKDGRRPQNQEIFVFGSNLAGIHGGGAALAAKKQYGALSVLTGGDYATMHFLCWDGKRPRAVIAYVGEDGIEPNVAYRLDKNHKPVRVSA